ncbi:MAG: polymorphic toxin type 15 domain-containing protein [Sporolactobacillus sp.]
MEPLRFNAEAFYHSEAYRIQGNLEKQTAAYLSFKKQQEQARQVSKKGEEAVNRPRYEKTGSELEKAAHIYDEVNDGIDDGVFDTAKDAVVGLWDLAKSPQKMVENMVHAGRHPVKTIELLANALNGSFQKNMVHGNAYTRTHWITYAVATIALSLFGTKGIDKVGKMVDVGKLVGKVNQAGTVTKSMFAEKTSAIADKISSFQNPFTPKYQFAGGNVPYNTINSKGLKDQLLEIRNNDRVTGNISRKGNKSRKGLDEHIEGVKKRSSDSVQEIHQKAKVDGTGNIGEKSAVGIERANEFETPLVNVHRIDKIEVRFKQNNKYDPEKFARQLKDQERGMNKLTVEEYLANRERYLSKGRAIEESVAQQAAREEAYAQKLNELQRNGISFSQAKKEAKEWLNTQAALHNPDQIAGGKADIIGGIGDKEINSSIGSQWKYRIDTVDKQIKKMAENMTTEQLKNTYLNVKLIY